MTSSKLTSSSDENFSGITNAALARLALFQRCAVDDEQLYILHTPAYFSVSIYWVSVHLQHLEMYRLE